MPRPGCPQRQAAVRSRVKQACLQSYEDDEESEIDSVSDDPVEDMRTAHLRADLRDAGSKDVDVIEAVTDAKGNVWTMKNSMAISL